jgi:hypothetical protein
MPRLDRVYRQDLRSLEHRVGEQLRTADRHPIPRSYTWWLRSWLDQLAEGACVGFGYSHDLLARPGVVPGIENQYARTLYWLIQQGDPWAGGAYPGVDPDDYYEGTSVLTGAQVLTQLGYYTSYKWALDAQETAEGIGYHGPAILGLDWWSGMFDTDRDGFIWPSGRVEGGHCIIAVGVRIVWKAGTSTLQKRSNEAWSFVDWQRSYIVLHNSWGPSWGTNGRAKITFTAFDALMRQQGEACFPTRSGKNLLIPISLAA